MSVAVLCFHSPASAALDSVTQKTSGPLSITRMTPSDENVPVGRQIVLQFNHPVVPLGRMERDEKELPITITPKLDCQWRWLNTSALACNLDEKNQFLPATTYQVTVKPGILDEQGNTLSEAATFSFTTIRPAVSYSRVERWIKPGMPLYHVRFNQNVTLATLKKHIYFELSDPLPRRVSAVIRPYGNTMPAASLKHAAQQEWLIRPKRKLPLSTSVSLVADSGIASGIGHEKSDKRRVVAVFPTFPELTFLGVRCYHIDRDDQIELLTPQDSRRLECNPMKPIALSFSRPIHKNEAKRELAITPKLGNLWNPPAADDEELEEEESYYNPLETNYQVGQTYDIWLPYGLKSEQEYRVKTGKGGHGFFTSAWYSLKRMVGLSAPRTSLEDAFGESLVTPIDMTFVTSRRKPNFVLPNNHSLLEKGVDSEIPLYVNNLNTYSLDYRSVTPQGGVKSNAREVVIVPEVDNIQFAMPMPVRKILGGSGALYGSVSTYPEVAKYPAEHQLFAQVTPYQVQMKLGHYRSLLWVVDMATGNTVPDARVRIYKRSLMDLGEPGTVLATAVTDKDGVAILPGTETLDPMLDLMNVWRDSEERLIARVDKGEDMALLPLSSPYSLSTYQSGTGVSEDNFEKNGHIRAWGTTAQGVYRAGSTIQYKFYVRKDDNRTLSPAPKGNYTLDIINPKGEVVETVKDVRLSEFGAYQGEYEVPESALMGWYQFRLTSDFAPRKRYHYNPNGDYDAEVDNKFTWFPLKVLVSDFTPSPFRVKTELNGDRFLSGDNVAVQSNASLHSGGAYPDAKSRITATITAQSFAPKNQAAQGFQFDSSYDVSDQTVFSHEGKLDGKGESTSDFAVDGGSVIYGKLTVETAVQDDRGKNVASSASADYAGVDRFVGVKTKDWMFETGKDAVVQYIVTDAAGNPAEGTEVELLIQRQKVTVSRVKGAGNAYESRYDTSWVTVHTCHGTSGKEAGECHFTPEKAGYYQAVATVHDTKDRIHKSTYYAYVLGGDFVLWSDSDYALDLVPEKTEWKVGDTARYMVKNPYPNATALITIERNGVMDHFVQTFDTSTPIVSFPVTKDYMPGYYMSVTLFSPRVDKPLGVGNVDLGKPAMRFGYASAPVSDKAKEIIVTAKTDKEVYRPRDMVSVKLHAAPRIEGTKEPIELAVIVLDEAVFDLISAGKSYFDPYAGLYHFGALDLSNYSLLNALIGRQKFEKKGANPGGDGGAALSLRNLFKFVAYWNPSLKTDSAGNATAEFAVPDNLTGWRVLAIAATPTDQLGLGETNFKVNRPTEVRPVMPNQVTEGDEFSAGASVMNRTDKDRTLDVTFTVEGNVNAKAHPLTLTKKITLKPYARETVTMPVKSSAVADTREQAKGDLRFAITAGDAVDTDGMEHHVPVLKARSLDVAATYGTTLQNHAETSIAVPKDIYPDSGEISVSLSPSVLGNLEGAFRYMRDYPYYCWEQRLSKGVMAAEYLSLKSYLPDTLEWSGSDKIITQMLKDASSFQAPNGGMTYYRAENGYTDPYLSAYTALAFTWLKDMKYDIPPVVEAKLQGYLTQLLRRDITAEGYTPAMHATVRAVALEALSRSGKATKEDVLRLSPVMKQMSLFGKTSMLQASQRIGKTDAVTKDAMNQILSQSNQTSGKFIFNDTFDGENLSGEFDRILVSPLRENCAILSAFTALGENPYYAEAVGDIPFKLVRTITQTRGARDHWENTQENIFCMNALLEFSRAYEQEKPAMQVIASWRKNELGEAEFNDLRDPVKTIAKPITAEYVGQKSTLDITREGTGRLYYTTRLSYAPKASIANSVNAGIELKREYSVERGKKWELVNDNTTLAPGDIVRVDLYLALPAARNFVVVDDPVPGGLEPINRDLATASVVDADKGNFAAAGGSFWFKRDGWIDYGISRWSFYHQEIRHDAVRFYSEYLAPGNYHLSYTAQVISPGEFRVMPSLAQEMYDTDVYGKDVPWTLKVHAASR